MSKNASTAPRLWTGDEANSTLNLYDTICKFMICQPKRIFSKSTDRMNTGTWKELIMASIHNTGVIPYSLRSMNKAPWPSAGSCNKAGNSNHIYHHLASTFHAYDNDIFTSFCASSLCAWWWHPTEVSVSAKPEANAQSTMLVGLFNPVVTGQFITVQI